MITTLGRTKDFLQPNNGSDILVTMNRYEKLEWLEQTCSEKFMKEEFVLAMVSWMGEDEFEAFYDHLCRNWDIARNAEEIEEIDYLHGHK